VADANLVVVINVYNLHCDVLVLMTGLNEVMYIPLNSISYEKVQELQQALDELLFHAYVRAQDM
jgi:hypothetical protein